MMIDQTARRGSATAAKEFLIAIALPPRARTSRAAANPRGETLEAVLRGRSNTETERTRDVLRHARRVRRGRGIRPARAISPGRVRRTVSHATDAGPEPQQRFPGGEPAQRRHLLLSWSPVANFLVATAWDGDVYCYEVGNNGQAMPKASQKHQGPVLCSDWSHDGSAVFSGGCDNKAQKWDLATNTPTQVAQHDAPIKELCWIKEVG